MAVEQSTEAGAGLSDVLSGLWRRKWFILSMWLAGSLLGYVAVRQINPTYQSEAQILITNPQALPGENPEQRQGEPAPVDARRIASELAILNSDDLARRVIAQLGLTKNPEFNSKLSSRGALTNLRIMLGFKDDPSKVADEDLALSEFESSASIYQLPESNVLGIKMSLLEPKLAAEVANAVADTYVNATRIVETEAAGETRDWLAGQIEELRRKVSAAEAEVEKYRASKGLLEGARETTIGTQEISELTSQITVAEAAATEASARAREIVDLLNTKGSVDTSSDVLNSEAVRVLREQQLAATRRISELSATYLENHPKMIAARRELRDVDRQLRREALKVVDSLQGQAKIAAARAKSINDRLEKLKQREGGAILEDVQLKALQREAAASRALLEQLLIRFATLNATSQLQNKPTYARIIQRASVPTSIFFPKPGPFVAVASLAGLLGGLGLAFLAEVMRLTARSLPAGPDPRQTAAQSQRAWRVDDAAPKQDLPPPPPPLAAKPIQSAVTAPSPVQAPMPRTVAPQPTVPPELMPQATLVEKANTSTSDTSAQLANALVKLKNEHAIFASRFAGQTKFKTDVALFVVATARAAAAKGEKVLVIDADPSSHALEPLFDLEPGPGLSDLVEGSADFTKIIRRDQQSTAHVISYGASRSAETAAALVSRMPSIISNLSDVYDLVFVHAGDEAPTTPDSLLGCKSVIMIVLQSEQRDLAPAEQSLHDLGAESVMHVTLLQDTILT